MRDLAEREFAIECGLISGSAGYDPEPLEPPAAGNLLFCCSRPGENLAIDIQVGPQKSSNGPVRLSSRTTIGPAQRLAGKPGANAGSFPNWKDSISVFLSSGGVSAPVAPAARNGLLNSPARSVELRTTSEESGTWQARCGHFPTLS